MTDQQLRWMMIYFRSFIVFACLSCQILLPSTLQANINIDNAIEEMGKELRAGYERKDWRELGAHPIFGSFSFIDGAIASYWAIFELGLKFNLLHDVAAEIESTLTNENILKELYYIAQSSQQPPRPDYPFALMWFLRLSTTFEMWAQKYGVASPDRMIDAAKALANSYLPISNDLEYLLNSSQLPKQPRVLV